MIRLRPTGPSAFWTAVRLSYDADPRATVATLGIFAVRPSLAIVTTYFVRDLIDALVQHSTATAVTAVCAIVVMAGLSAATVAPAVELSVRMIEATAAEVDHRLMELMSRPHGVSHLDDPQTLDQVEALGQERVRLSEGVDSISLVLGTSVRAVVIVVMLAVVDPWLVLCPLLAVPTLLASRRLQRLRGVAVDRSAPDARLARHLFAVGSSPQSAAELRTYGFLPMLRHKHSAAGGLADQQVLQAMSRGLPLVVLASATFAAGYAGALLLVLWRLTSGAASIGDVVLTLGLVTSISVQMADVTRCWTFMLQTLAAVRRLMRFEEFVSELMAATPSGTRMAPHQLRDAIVLDDVGFKYPGTDRWALRHVNLRLPAGSLVALVGDNGAGKSTLVKLLAGLYQPTEGAIFVDGIEVATLAPQSWYAHSSACFQDFAQLEFSVSTSVGLGELTRLDDGDAIDRAISEGTADELVAGLPAGRHTRLGSSFDDGVGLSGGQWQRLALSRARMRPAPCLLVLDEPTAAIDPLAEDTVLRGYLAAARRTVASGQGVTVFVSHRLSTARGADQVAVIHGGALTECGSHDELMEHNGAYSQMYRGQQRAYS